MLGVRLAPNYQKGKIRLSKPIIRLLALGASVAFGLAMFLKLWVMTLISTFYYDGLHLNVYASKVTGDLSELNILNHYIGMMNIDNSLPELQWIPWVFRIIVLLCLIIAIWPSRLIVTGGIILIFVGLVITAGDFYYRLYEYGHNFDPSAAIKVPVFTPKIIGDYTLANFSVTTGFGVGGYLTILGAILLIAAFVYNLKSQKVT